MQPWQPQQPQHPQAPEAWTPQKLPGALPLPTTEDRDLASLSPFLPKVAASFVALAGLFALLGSFQTWATMMDLDDDLWQIAPVLDALLGVACIAVATRLAVARRWAALAALVLSAVTLLPSSAWAFYSVSSHFYAAFIVLTPPACLAATALAALSISACDRAERARDRLKSQGLDLGL